MHVNSDFYALIFITKKIFNSLPVKALNPQPTTTHQSSSKADTPTSSSMFILRAHEISHPTVLGGTKFGNKTTGKQSFLG